MQGSFLTHSGEPVAVHIVTDGNRAEQLEIGSEESGVFFAADDPVTIDSCVNDTFDHLLRSQASIRLIVRNFIPELFCASCMDAVVNIFKGDKCIFAGFIEPQAYSQNYNDSYDELEISCIDVLSALQYCNYAGIGQLGVSYNSVKSSAAQLPLRAVIDKIINALCPDINITGNGGAVRLYYDGSKALTATSDRYAILDEIAITELLFLGDDEDSVWTYEDVLTAMLKYLNLHIVQCGFSLYMFSWESVKADSDIAWRDILGSSEHTSAKQIVNISLENVASDDTQISIGEVYNRIILTCKTESVENVIESPLSDDALISPYSNKQLYLTEYSAEGEGKRAYDAFRSMTLGENTDYEGAVVTDWFIQVQNNPDWIFPGPVAGSNLIDHFCAGNTNQQALPNHLGGNPGATLVSWGKVEKKMDKKDNAPVSKVDMNDYLVVSVNGNGKNDPDAAYPSENSLAANAPCAVYNGANTGAVYSPADEHTTNYIVISGKIVLNPLMEMTGDYRTLQGEWAPAPGMKLPYVWGCTVPSRNNGDGRYYTQKYYKAAKPADTPAVDTSIAQGLIPFTETGPQQYEFKYSAIGDGTDTVSKVAVLACMLVIGDKCLVETGTQGQPSDFEWRPYKTREQCLSDDEYWEQCFTIGFDPKIGDKLIGTEFDIQNNITYTMGIDAEGIAIPIRKDTHLSGAVKFCILGPVNSLWGDITRRHKTWFRRTKWTENMVPLMAHVSNILIKSFEVKIYSDNGLINNTEDSDIVYMSDTAEKFINPKDDIDFEISSALTLAECQALGVNDAVRLSTPLDMSTGLGLLSIYDYNRGVQAKPEQMYVDSYYTEYHRPRVLMTQKLTDSSADLFWHYVHPAMADKKFYVQGISRNILEDYAELTIKEVWND